MNRGQHRQLLLDTCLQAGKIMAESGSEVYRVEDTMNRIAANAGEPNSVSYVTATGLFMSLPSCHLTQLETINDRIINLEKVVAVNSLSRQFAQQQITLADLHQQLLRIDADSPSFPLSWQILSAGLVSSTLMILFGGSWLDFLPTFIVGMLGFITSFSIKRLLAIRFLNDFAAAFVIGTLAFGLHHFQLATSIDNIIIGAVMPLVPGVAITNAFRDILAGHLISGTARATEAIIVAAAIGVGIATVFKLFV